MKMSLPLFFMSLFSCFLHSVDDLSAIIRNNIQNPQSIIQEHLESFNNDEIVTWRDKKYNNLLHITVQALLVHAQDSDYKELVQKAKPLCQYLVYKGVPTNEFNDDWKAPHFLLYDHDSRDHDFEHFLEFQLNADPTYFSIKPGIRKMKREIYNLCCGSCLKARGKEKNN